MNSSKQIKFGAMMSYFAIAVNIIAGLVYTPWMITKIGQANYGLYTITSSLITMFIMDFGMSAAVTRFVSLYRAKGEQKKADEFMGLVYKLYGIIDIVIFVILFVVFFFIESIYKNLTPDEISVLKGLYIIVGIYNIISFPFTPLNGIMNAYEKFIQAKACDLFHKIFIIVTVVIALALGGGVRSLVLANAASGIVTLLLKYIVVRKKTELRADLTYFDKGMLKEIFGFSVWTTVASLAQRLIFNITPTIIAAVSVTGSIGTAVFGLASTIEGYVYTFATAINGMFMPKISRIITSGKKDEELLPLMIKIGRIQIAIVGFIIGGFIALGQSFIIDIWRKADFADTYICAVLLIIPSFFYLPQQIANTALIVENRVKQQAFVFIGMGAINVVLSLILSKYYGAIGASVAIFAAYMFRTVVMDIIYYKDMKLNIPKFFKESFLKMTPAVLIALAVGVLADKFNPIGGYLGFLINGCIYAGTFAALMWFVCFNEYEKNLFLGMVKKILRKAHLVK